MLNMDFFSVFLVLSSLGWCCCIENLVATPLIQSLYSHTGYGTTKYPAGNYSKDWYITTHWINHTIKINIKTCNIESPKEICTYDFLYVYDGSNNNATELLKTCCGKPFTDREWESSNGEMYLLFETDYADTETGFEIEYWSNGITTTTSTTPAPTTGRSTTTLQTSSSSAQVITTETSSAAPGESDNSLYIIIACAVTGLLVLVVVVLIIVMCIKKNRPVVPQSFLIQTDKPVPVKNGKNKIALAGPPPTPPIGTMISNVETNLFDLELPEKPRGNTLPPLYSSTVVTNLSN